MILIMPPEPSGLLTNKAAAYDATRPGMTNASMPERNVTFDNYGSQSEPSTYVETRRPFAGLRAVMGNLTRNGVPALPLGPSRIALLGPGYNPAGRPPRPVRTVQQYVPVTTPSNAGEWYEYLR